MGSSPSKENKEKEGKLSPSTSNTSTSSSASTSTSSSSTPHSNSTDDIINHPNNNNKTSYPEHVIDASKVGDVYVIVYGTNKSPVKDKDKENLIYTVVIDVAGESTEVVPMGLEIFLGKEKKGIRLFEERLCELRPKYVSHQLVGKIDNLYHAGQPQEWAKGLKGVISGKWFPVFQQTKGPLWSQSANSQNYAKYLIDTLKENNPHSLTWPNQLKTPTDNNSPRVYIPQYIDILAAK
ncbi:hypothetical protein DFA_08915 [Cavenderia fasciculata]|uniref:Uncharacterized protein n=1 Tax=Cavenderia fasciculata TaxID=261658 RepID=F4Q521_CACFS|nr:uncharacterized protein DFA_08915 [Cavenderia fasciculata]EGG17914.1 hypothetical protein DFA_08915 [Cavenderia fasciculata]|eukprot:XP_004356398.1 hypothetical protein DFA_08915 [Cavenderia fasciculata]